MPHDPACSCEPPDDWLCRTVRRGVARLSDHELRQAAWWLSVVDRRDCYGTAIRAEMTRRNLAYFTERPPTYERR